jgi:hypothetical protein
MNLATSRRTTWKNIKKKNERKWRPSGWWLSASQMSNIYNNFVRVYKVPNTIPGNSIRSPQKWLFSVDWVHHGLQLPAILAVLKHNKCSAVTLCIYADPAHWRSGISIDILVDGLTAFYLNNIDRNGCERLTTSGIGMVSRQLQRTLIGFP